MLNNKVVCRILSLLLAFSLIVVNIQLSSTVLFGAVPSVPTLDIVAKITEIGTDIPNRILNAGKAGVEEASQDVICYKASSDPIPVTLEITTKLRQDSLPEGKLTLSVKQRDTIGDPLGPVMAGSDIIGSSNWEIKVENDEAYAENVQEFRTSLDATSEGDILIEPLYVAGALEIKAPEFVKLEIITDLNLKIGNQMVWVGPLADNTGLPVAIDVITGGMPISAKVPKGFSLLVTNKNANTTIASLTMQKNEITVENSPGTLNMGIDLVRNDAVVSSRADLAVTTLDIPGVNNETEFLVEGTTHQFKESMFKVVNTDKKLKIEYNNKPEYIREVIANGVSLTASSAGVYEIDTSLDEANEEGVYRVEASFWNLINEQTTVTFTNTIKSISGSGSGAGGPDSAIARVNGDGLFIPDYSEDSKTAFKYNSNLDSTAVSVHVKDGVSFSLSVLGKEAYIQHETSEISGYTRWYSLISPKDSFTVNAGEESIVYTYELPKDLELTVELPDKIRTIAEDTIVSGKLIKRLVSQVIDNNDDGLVEVAITGSASLRSESGALLGDTVTIKRDETFGNVTAYTAFYMPSHELVFNYSAADLEGNREPIETKLLEINSLISANYCVTQYTTLMTEAREIEDELLNNSVVTDARVSEMLNTLVLLQAELIDISSVVIPLQEFVGFVGRQTFGFNLNNFLPTSNPVVAAFIENISTKISNPAITRELVAEILIEFNTGKTEFEINKVMESNMSKKFISELATHLTDSYYNKMDLYTKDSFSLFTAAINNAKVFADTITADTAKASILLEYNKLLSSTSLLELVNDTEAPMLLFTGIRRFINDENRYKISIKVKDSSDISKVNISAGSEDSDSRVVLLDKVGEHLREYTVSYSISKTTTDKSLIVSCIDAANNALNTTVDMDQVFTIPSWEPNGDIDFSPYDPGVIDPDPDPNPDPAPDPDPNVKWSFDNPIFNSGRYSTLASSLPLVITVDVPYPTTKTRAANEFILKVGEGVQSSVSYGAATATAKLTFTQPTDISIGFELAKGSTSLGLKKVRFIVEKAGNGGGGTTPDPADKPDKVIKGLLDTDTLIYGIDALDKGGILDVNIKTNYKIHGDVLRYLKGQQKALALYDDYDGYTYILKGTDISRVRLDSSDVLDLRPIISDYYWNTELKDIVGKDYMHIGFDFMQPGFRSTFGVATEWNAKNLYAYSVIDSDKKEFELVWEGKTTSRGLAEFQLEYFGDVILTPVKIADKYVIGKNGSGSGTSSDGGGNGGTGNGTSSGGAGGTIPVDTVGTKPKPPSNNPQTGGLTERYVFGNVLETNRQTRKLNLSVVALMLTINTLGAIAIVMLTKGVPIVRDKGKKTRVRNSVV